MVFNLAEVNWTDKQKSDFDAQVQRGNLIKPGSFWHGNPKAERDSKVGRRLGFIEDKMAERMLQILEGVRGKTVSFVDLEGTKYNPA